MEIPYVLAAIFLALGMLLSLFYFAAPYLISALIGEPSMTPEAVCPEKDPCAELLESCTEPKSRCLVGCMANLCTELRNWLKILIALSLVASAASAAYGKFRPARWSS